MLQLAGAAQAETAQRCRASVCSRGPGCEPPRGVSRCSARSCCDALPHCWLRAGAARAAQEARPACVVWKRAPLSSSRNTFSPSSPLRASFSRYVCACRRAPACARCPSARAALQHSSAATLERPCSVCLKFVVHESSLGQAGQACLICDSLAHVSMDVYQRPEATRTLASMSYRLASRMPSTRARRQAASPATSALVKRCLVIASYSQHQFTAHLLAIS